MSDEAKKPILRPGFASEEEPNPEEVIESPAGHAHYNGLTDVQAAEAYEKETLCVRCLCAGVCVVAMGAKAPLAVVSRCLSFLPASG